ncbi:MAG: GAF domain-containing protein [Leptolyngbyaceae cyanobacterium]
MAAVDQDARCNSLDATSTPAAGDSFTSPTANLEPSDSIAVPVELVGSAIERSPTAALARRSSFAAFLEPLTKDTFKQVVQDVHQKLLVVHDTLSVLDNLLDAQSFDAILHEMLRSITLKTGELLNADRTTIFLLDEDNKQLWSIVAQTETGENLELRFDMNRGIAGEVATQKHVINIPYDFYDDPRSETAKEFDRENHYRTYTMLALPLLDQAGALVAVVQLLNKLKPDYDPDAPLEQQIDDLGFSDYDEQVFNEFAPSIRLIIESSRSFYRAIRQQRAASALMKATQSLSRSSLDLEETLKRVMDEAKELMQADRSALWLLDQEKNQLWTKLLFADGSVQEKRIARNEGFAGKVAESGQPLLIPFDLYDDPGSKTSQRTDKETGYRTCSMLCMPVFNADGELIGVTQLVNKKLQGEYPPYDPKDWPDAPDCWKASFNRSDQEFMQAFNIQAGVALQNAKLFQTVKQQEQNQRDILRSLSDGVISTDKHGMIVAANESAKKLLPALDLDSSLNEKRVTDLIKLKKEDRLKDKPDEENVFRSRFERALNPINERDRNQYYPEQILSSENNAEHSINLSINTMANADDPAKVSGVLVVMEDLSYEKRLKSTMYRYMSQKLAEQLLENPDELDKAKLVNVSILFSDIRGYTTLAESLGAEKTVKMLNDYFEVMVDAVFKFNGTLDKFIGDAIMAVYGSPLKLPEHAWQAVKTAIAMRDQLKKFNAKRLEQGEEPIQIGIGINSGGAVSASIGTSQRMEFTALGDEVNLGSRLEGATKQYGTDIIISEKTYNACRDLIWARELDFVKVKGKHQPVKIYELVGINKERVTDDDDIKEHIIDGITEAQRQKIEHYELGLKYYRDRKFEQAKREFETVLLSKPDDKAAILYVERCEYWQKVSETSPADMAKWEPWSTLTEK